MPPRVLAAAWRTIWNGWCTAARFQKRAPCVLGCGNGAQDRIEHYANCDFLRWVAKAAFGICPSKVTLAHFLLLEDGMETVDCIKSALLAYTMYMVTNAYRGQERVIAEEVKDSLVYTLRGAARDSRVQSSI